MRSARARSWSGGHTGNARAHRGCDTLRDVADPLASVASACRRLTETRKPRATVQKKWSTDDEPVRWGASARTSRAALMAGLSVNAVSGALARGSLLGGDRYGGTPMTGGQGAMGSAGRYGGSLLAGREGTRAAASAPADPPPSRAPATTTAPTATFAPCARQRHRPTPAALRADALIVPPYPRVWEAGATRIRVRPPRPRERRTRWDARAPREDFTSRRRRHAAQGTAPRTTWSRAGRSHRANTARAAHHERRRVFESSAPIARISREPPTAQLAAARPTRAGAPIRRRGQVHRVGLRARSITPWGDKGKTLGGGPSPVRGLNMFGNEPGASGDGFGSNDADGSPNEAWVTTWRDVPGSLAAVLEAFQRDGDVVTHDSFASSPGRE